MRKIIDWILKLFGIKSKIPTWDKCTLSSNWTGKNASKRMMNILSPHMDDATFNDRVKWIKGRGCNCVHVFVTNKADGEKAGYSPYGNKFDFIIDKNYTNVMNKRIEKLIKEKLGVVLWLMADDSTAWAKAASSNWSKYCQDIRDLGWFDKASTVVIGLEIEEYWNNTALVANLINTLRKYYKGKIGTHHVSNGYGLALGDLAFLQMNPGRSAGEIKSFVQKSKSALNKPINMFELERNEDKVRSQVALDAGAFGIGNW